MLALFLQFGLNVWRSWQYAVQDHIRVVFRRQDVGWTCVIWSNLQAIRHAELFSTIKGIVMGIVQGRWLLLRSTSLLVVDLNLSTILANGRNLRVVGRISRLLLVQVPDIDY